MLFRSELALTRAGPHCLERILVRIHVTRTHISSNHFGDVDRFSVVYKTARAEGGPLAPLTVGDEPLGDVPVLEEQRCIDISSSYQHLSTNPKWAVFELRTPMPDTVRILRISLRWGESGDPSEAMRGRIAIELSEPYVTKKKSAGPTVDARYTPTNEYKDSLVREREEKLESILVGLWKHWVTDDCVHGPEDVYSRSAVLCNLIGADDDEGTRRMPWDLW